MLKSHSVLFLLPELSSQTVLCVQDEVGKSIIPAYPELVDENAGFDDPQYLNDYFEKLTGVKVFRRYSFTYEYYCVLVLERAGDGENLYNGCSWINYKSIAENKIIESILTSTIENYNKSKNMPWVNENGFKPYFDWVHKTLEKHNIKATGIVRQRKNAYVSNVFEFSTSQGSIYLKIPGRLFIRELRMTEELMKLNIIKLPVWISSNDKMNAMLMMDMGGDNLSYDADLNTLSEIILEYAELQKRASGKIDMESTNFYDYRLDKIEHGIREIPSEVRKLSENLKTEISAYEIESLRLKIEWALDKLYQLRQTAVPYSIEHGDLRPGNIRVTDQGYIIYDWSLSMITHPFVGVSQFLHTIRKNVTKDQQEQLINTYLKQWMEYSDFDSLKAAYAIVEELRNFFFLYADFHWLKEILDSGVDPLAEKSADGWLVKRRFYYFKKDLTTIVNTV